MIDSTPAAERTRSGAATQPDRSSAGHLQDVGRTGGFIVHVSADYPDAIEPGKTRAIETFVRLADSAFDQQVISLNRMGVGARFFASLPLHPLRPRLDVWAGEPAARTTPVCYRAPGKGVYHATMLRQLGEWLAERIARGPRPALIVGHKLTFEGLAVAEAARLLNVPYALTIQGDSDLKVLGRRPDLRPVIGACYHGAAIVVAIAPWALRRVAAHLGERPGPSVVVPCAVAADRVIAPRTGGNGLISVFHLRNQRRKNLQGMAQALGRAGPRAARAHLSVIGGGSEAEIGAARAIADRYGNAHITLEGQRALPEIPERMNRATGYIMPSLRESFGLVFIEALMAGLPIAYPQGWAVDGFLDDQPFAIPVDAHSVESIADAMAHLVRDEGIMKRALTVWQHGGGLDRFASDHIASAYIEALTVAIRSAAPGVQ